TALVHNLLTGGKLPGFAPRAQGRFIGAQIVESPDAAIPRFAYEQHLEALTGKAPYWPEGTRRISQLRLALKFQSQNWWSGWAGASTLNLDIVDYPGEWLLDLPLLSLSYAEWSAQALARAKALGAPPEARAFLDLLAATDTARPMQEPDAERLAAAFTE